MIDRGFLQFLLEVVQRTEIALDRGEQVAGGFGLRRAQAFPIESMVPRLRGIVEQALVARPFGVVDDLLERLRREVGAFDRGVGLVDIGLVMLAMVRSEEHTSELQSIMRHSY